MKQQRPSKKRVVLIAIGSVLLVAILGFLIWTQLVMAADRSKLDIVRNNSAIRITDTGSSIILRPSQEPSNQGLVFIPGAKVDPWAYVYKLSGVVEQSHITVVITKPILNLALLDFRGFDTFTALSPDITLWSVGGHSLGGVKACQYATDKKIVSLVLMAAYCTNDVTVKTLSIYGNNDRLTTQQKIADNKQHLRGSVTDYLIGGASHASFGDYGVQAGDGVATLPSDGVRKEITAGLVKWLR